VSDPKINISMTVDFFRIPCSLLKMEAQDTMGGSTPDVLEMSDSQMTLYVLSDAQQIMEAFTDKETDITRVVKDLESNMGCRLTGQLEVYKSPGFLRVYLDATLYH
jgi:hypothetical protein